MELVAWFKAGGPAMYPILACSLIGLAYIIYCALILRRGVALPDRLLELSRTLASEEQCAAADEVCRREGGPFAEILRTVIATRQSSREEAETLVESAGARAAHRLSHGILALEVVAAISPLLGLLGTVLGMYDTFAKIATVGVKEIGKLSGGISQALITTIAGLIVAIPAYIAFTWFSRRVDALVLEMEQQAVALMFRLRK